MIFGGLLFRGWIVMPVAPHLFQESRLAGQAIDTALKRDPKPLYVAGGDSTDLNMLVYVQRPISAIALNELAELNVPAIAVLRPEHQRALLQTRPELRLIEKNSVVSGKTRYNIIKIIPSG